tara:strand:+ start:289 stop:567 length:279 start_codon:yes stop_codon:yes gene_type:complete
MTSYKWNDEGNLMRSDQSMILPKPGDRFFDVANGRWALLLRILPKDVALGAPYESIYDGCERYQPYIATAMLSDIGEVIQCIPNMQSPEVNV